MVWTEENASLVHERVSQRLVDCCMKNEGLYIKFAQALSAFSMILPKEYQSKLDQFQDSARTYPYEEIQGVLAASIGGEALSEFDIEPQPVASASIAQVHRGLHKASGKHFAFKIQKPNVRFQHYYDLTMLRFFLYALEHSFGLPLMWSYDYTRRVLESELDFTLEAQNSIQTKTYFADKSPYNKFLYVPETLLARPRVLVTEWVADACKISDRESIVNAGLSPTAILQDATSVFAHQIFTTGHVHCDPHPGNLMVRPHPTMKRGWLASLFGRPVPHQVVLLDHGMYVELPASFRAEYADLWLAMVPPVNREKVTEICRGWGFSKPDLWITMSTYNGSRTGAKTLDGKDGGQSLVDRMLVKQSNERKLQSSKPFEALTESVLQRNQKEEFKNSLMDVSKTPREIIFVSRAQNFLRAANWKHGNPVDRVLIMATAAAEMRGQSIPSSWSFNKFTNTVQRWILSTWTMVYRTLSYSY